MPRAPRFSQRDIASAKVGRTFVKDTPGLYLHTNPPSKRYPEGRQKWILRYSRPHKAGVTEKSAVTEKLLGYLPYTTLKRAKEIVEHFRRHLNDGQDPVAMEQWNKREQTTFKQVADMWIEKERPVRSDGWLYNARNLLHNYARDLANLRLIQITPDHIYTALKGKPPEQTNRARRYVKTVLDYAVAKEYLPRGMINPAQWDAVQEHHFPSQPKKGRRHHSAPHYKETPALILETRKHEERSVGAMALRFAFYTVKRTSEVLGARWSEVDFENQLWTIPAERMKKNDEGEHQVPLSEQAMALLLLRKQERLSPYIFPSYDTRKHLDDHAMSGLLRRMGIPYTVHGSVRATFKQWALEQTTYPRELIEMSFAHKVGNAVEQAYARDAQAVERRRPLMQEWADYCDSKISL
jgi:integrase